MKKFSFIYLPLLFFIYILTETVMKFNHMSLCESTGCLLADNLLRFDSLYLNYIGLLDASLILLTGWIGYKKRIIAKIFYLVVFSSLLFETVLIGYQYFVSPEMCKFCMGVYAFLVLIALLSSRIYFLMVIPAVVSVVMALSFLSLPKSEAFVMNDGNYLIQSSSCPHCKKVKSYLSEQNISFSKIDIEDIEARNFATFLDFKTIPILLIKEGKKVQIINGDSNIIERFKALKRSEDEPVNIVEEAVVSGDSNSALFDTTADDEGCGFTTLTQVESNCSQ